MQDDFDSLVLTTVPLARCPRSRRSGDTLSADERSDLSELFKREWRSCALAVTPLMMPVNMLSTSENKANHVTMFEYLKCFVLIIISFPLLVDPSNGVATGLN